MSQQQCYRHKTSGVLLGMHPAYASMDILELVVVESGPDGHLRVVSGPEPEEDEAIPSVDAPEGQLGAALPAPAPIPASKRRRRGPAKPARTRR